MYQDHKQQQNMLSTYSQVNTVHVLFVNLLLVWEHMHICKGTIDFITRSTDLSRSA